MAVGEFGAGPAYALTYNGSTWSNPTEIDAEGNNAMHSVSCASPSFCVTVGNSNDELTYNGSTWSPTQVGHGGYIESVSCHSESFCVAVSPGGGVVAYNGIMWSPTSAIGERAARVVSCPTQSFCVAVGGYASTYDGSNWSSVVPVGGGGLGSVSCSSPSLCTAVDFNGRVLSFNGSTWSAPSLVDPEGGLDSVSCPSTGFCMAAGGRQHHGYALAYNGSAWGAASEVDPEGEVQSVSCASAFFCVAVTEHTAEGHEHGYALTYHGGVWSAPSEIDGEAALRSVSCASEAFCVAVGRHDAVVYSGGSWGAPSQIAAEGNLRGVSCPSSTFCVASVEHNSPGLSTGEALTYNGAAWSVPSEIPRAPGRGGFDAGSVSCVSPSFCMATAMFEGAAATYESGTWSAWTSLEINGGFSSVSCPAVSFCVVVTDTGQAFTYGAPPTPPPTSSGAGATTSSGAPPRNPPIRKGKPLVNPKTGEITLEYDFPEAGEAEAYGEAADGTATAATQPAKKCKKQHTRNAKRCASNTPIRYGHTRLTIATAGTYKLHIKPSPRILAALRKGKTLTVRLTVIFTPTGTTDHISKTTTVKVHLKKAHQGRHHAKSKR